MSIKDIESKAIELQELKRMKEELEAEIESIEDDIKMYMNREDVVEVIAGAFKISWNDVVSRRFDSAVFKKANPDVAEQYMKTTVTRRFAVR